MRKSPSPARVAKKWKKLPKGWTDESVTKFWKTLGKGTPEHKVWNCIYKMTGVFDNPGAFCGGLADWKDPGWRQEITKQDPDARAQARKYWKAKIKGKGGKKASSARVALRFASMVQPLMLQPDYGHGDAAVPGDEEYHPCQHGLPCECGGGCGCGK